MKIQPLPPLPRRTKRCRVRRRPRARLEARRARLHHAELAATTITPADLDAALDQLSREWQIDL